MASRRTLWILLVLGSLPLFLEATTGCDVVFSLDRLPLQDNALRCACECDGNVTSSQVRVLASADDAEEDLATGAVDLVSGDLDFAETIVGIRFDGVGIPKGATIQSAYVQFTADEAQNVNTDLTIYALKSVAAQPFAAVPQDLSGRTVGLATPIAWSPGPWGAGATGAALQTPELKTLLQELVDQPGWSAQSPVALRFEGTGHRESESFDGDSPQAAPLLVVSYDSTVAAALPVCALAGSATDGAGRLTPASLAAECARVEDTLEGFAQACGYPTPCSCAPVDVPDQDDSFRSDVCDDACVEEALDEMTCSNFDPNGFADCLAQTASVDACKHLVAATNVAGDSPVCVTSGSPFAFQLYGRRSLCEVEGIAEIEVGDREPKQDPDTAGTIDFLGGPCPGGGCSVYPYFDLRMDPITFSVKWASDPTFGDLSASGRGLETAVVDAAGLATFPTDAIAGAGNGRRGSEGLALYAGNPDPVDFTIDWVARTCTMNGTLAAGVDGEVPDGTCTGDASVACTADSPDCDDVGGPCVFEDEDIEPMLVTVTLDQGDLVNQPPTAAAGPDQEVECTSPAGASFTLDGRGSSDPDLNLALASWREGSRIGPVLNDGLTAAHALGVGVSQSYVLRVIDDYAQADEDETGVAVVDTTPPELSLAVSPTTLWPPNHKFVKITALLATSDICDASPTIRLVSIASDESADGSGDGSTSPDVKDAAFGTDDRQFSLRAERSGNGDGRVYTITYEAVDDSGNTTQRQATVTVSHNK